MDRRTLLKTAAFAAAGPLAKADVIASLPLCIFSKHLQFLDWKGMAEAAKEIGFEGVDLTVRKGGHVLPERVADDLPQVFEIVKAAGLTLPMITTDVNDASDPATPKVLRAAAELGIRHYRWGGYKYKDNRGIAQQIEDLKPKVKELAALNRELGVCGMYHTHSGVDQVGASQWDLWLLVKDLDPRYIGFNYDIGHATVEGGLGGWVHSTRLAASHMAGVAMKDFRWEKGAKGWKAQWTPFGQGMVQLEKWLSMIREARFRGPAQIHYEYDLGGADTGGKLTREKSEVLAAMKRDLDYVRSAARAAGWV